jgi:hypothetical protein
MANRTGIDFLFSSKEKTRSGVLPLGGFQRPSETRVNSLDITDVHVLYKNYAHYVECSGCENEEVERSRKRDDADEMLARVLNVQGR